MSFAPLDYFIALLDAASVLLVCGACLARLQILGVAQRRGDTEGIEERNHSKEVI